MFGEAKSPRINYTYIYEFIVCGSNRTCAGSKRCCWYCYSVFILFFFLTRTSASDIAGSLYKVSRGSLCHRFPKIAGVVVVEGPAETSAVYADPAAAGARLQHRYCRRRRRRCGP